MRTKKLAVVGVVIVSAYYLYKRLKAGNQYAQTDQTGSNFKIWDYFGDSMSNNSNLPTLRYFTASEFGEWWPYMSTELLIKLDEFRHRLGVPVRISPVEGALGRHDGVTGTSQHNVDLWGEVRAADVMFDASVSLEHAYKIAKEVGFTGIGAYPDWKPSQGMHLDVRSGALALWSGVLEGGKQVYKSITQAFA